MSQEARPTRRYDASQRQAQAAQTRARIIEAARLVFLERGYAGATIPRIAAEAGVAVETVYRSAAGKAGLLEAAVQAALAGGVERADVPVEERPAIRRVIEETDPRAQIEAYSATQPGVWNRVGPLLRVLDAAATTDETLMALRQEHGRQRWEGLRRFASLLFDRGSLRAGLSVDRAADILWTVCAQANYDSLVIHCNWAHADYEAWLAETLAHAILAGPSRMPRP